MEVTYGRGYVYAMEFHIVWCTKYCRKVITPEVESCLKTLLRDYAGDNGFSIVEMTTCPDHVHLLISISPQVYIPDIMREMEGVSARMLFKSFPDIKDQLQGGHMWNPSYLIATVSDNTEAQIRDYIQSQKEG